MQTILSIAIKDLKLLLRDRGGFFFTFFYPILFALFFGLVFSPGGDETNAIKIDAVDLDQTPQSKAFLALLNSAAELDVVLTDSLHASRDVLGGKKVAYIILQKGFGAARENPFWGQPPQIELGIDPSKKADAGILTGILMKYGVQDMQNTFTDLSLMEKSTDRALRSLQENTDLPPSEKNVLSDLFNALKKLWQDSALNTSPENQTAFKGFEPLTIKEKSVVHKSGRVLNSFSITFPQGIVWGILACAISFAVSLVGERTRGTLFRIQAAFVKKHIVLGGKALASFIVSFSMALALVLIGFLIFGVQVHSWFMLIFALFMVSISFVGVMILFSVLGKTERTVSGLGWALVLPMAMLGGGMIPLAFMPHWLQTLSVISPVKWAILSIEGSLWRSFTWGQLLEPVSILLLIGLVSFGIGLNRFKWE